MDKQSCHRPCEAVATPISIGEINDQRLVIVIINQVFIGKGVKAEGEELTAVS